MNIRLSFPVEHGGRWDAERAEILTMHCRPLSHVCERLQQCASNFSVKMCVSSSQRLNPVFFHSSLQIQTRACTLAIVGFFLSFESPRNLVQQHFRGSRWRCAMSYIKSDDLLCVFMRPRVLFCVFPKMKVCFRCSFQSLRRARHRQG